MKMSINEGGGYFQLEFTVNTTIVTPCSGQGQAHVFLISSSPDADNSLKNLNDHFLQGSQ